MHSASSPQKPREQQLYAAITEEKDEALSALLKSTDNDIQQLITDHGIKALRLAAKLNNATAIALLSKSKADVTQHSKDNDPILYHVNLEAETADACIAILLAAKADPNALPTIEKKPILYKAAHAGVPTIVSALLDAKADPNQIMGYCSKLSLAETKEHTHHPRGFFVSVDTDAAIRTQDWDPESILSQYIEYPRIMAQPEEKEILKLLLKKANRACIVHAINMATKHGQHPKSCAKTMLQDELTKRSIRALYTGLLTPRSIIYRATQKSTFDAPLLLMLANYSGRKKSARK